LYNLHTFIYNLKIGKITIRPNPTDAILHSVILNRLQILDPTHHMAEPMRWPWRTHNHVWYKHTCKLLLHLKADSLKTLSNVRFRHCTTCIKSITRKAIKATEAVNNDIIILHDVFIVCRIAKMYLNCRSL